MNPLSLFFIEIPDWIAFAVLFTLASFLLVALLIALPGYIGYRSDRRVKELGDLKKRVLEHEERISVLEQERNSYINEVGKLRMEAIERQSIQDYLITGFKFMKNQLEEAGIATPYSIDFVVPTLPHPINEP